MKATKLRAVDMVRRIRDRHARQLAGKTEAEVIAFYRAAGEAATEDLRRAKRRRQKASYPSANLQMEPTRQAVGVITSPRRAAHLNR